ncbi:probable protein phosphatase 2C 21 isoform X2 [Dendroctonus ponderosae]|uniref:protein-serine/threonine phosphatase n=1 Tax=Dendroctonus ponderosae TaxID=77166 RepID=A0AAR5PQ80_DENPD|nr:probable protein phosphatase 2C 21 isoform X2 [Dendroctonus ponderosae]
MGSYLSEPVVEKVSSDGANDKLVYGASSMQGWRVKQEDAHNSILDYDENSTLFAVYDGHGGQEVAQYCSTHLPAYIKNTEAYKNGDIEQALIQGFLGFDATMTTKAVVDVLKEFAGDTEAEEAEEQENVNDLYEEAAMPIEQVIEKYTSLVNPLLKHMKKGSELNKSPMLTAIARTSSSSESSDIPPPNLQEAGSSGSASCSANKDSSETPEVNGEGEGKSAKANEDTKTPTNGSIPNIVITSPGSEVKETELEDDKNKKIVQNGDVTGEKHNLEDQSPPAPVCATDKENSSDEEGVNVSVEGGSEEESSDADDEEEAEEEEDDDELDDDEQDLEFARNMKEEPGSDSGCTAVVAILKERELYVANAGDSRCIVCRNGNAVEMSFDHKPEDAPERQRIMKAGGKVTGDGRVNGGLNLSRALGDHAYKQNASLSDKEQMITALPDVKKLTINPAEDEFMVLACDGIWNFMSSQQVVDFVKERLKDSSVKISSICEEMFDHCLAPNTMGDGTGCDNMTAIIVKFKPNLNKRAISPQPEENESKRVKTEES